MLLTSLLQVASGDMGLGTIGATLSAALVVFAAAFGISKIGATALEAIARQPEAANDIRMSMIIVGALVEGAALFAIVVCLLAITL